MRCVYLDLDGTLLGPGGSLLRGADGALDLEEATALLAEAGLAWLRLLDNGVVRAAAEQMPGLDVIHAYHLIPAAASKARAVARHMRARAYASEDCVAVGDSREDLEVSSVGG